MLSKRVNEIAPSLVFEILGKAQEMTARGDHVVNFSIGEPDFKTPDFVIAAAKKALDTGYIKYTPTRGLEKLRGVICDKLKRDNNLSYTPNQIVVSSGCKQSLYNALSALVNPGDEVIIFAPYWMTYTEQIKLCGGKVKIVKNFSPENLEKAITPKTKAVIINSPNNPSGAVYTQKEIESIARVIEKHPQVFVISDEIYEKLIYNGTKHYSIAGYNKTLCERTIVVNGLSKAFAMTGWRVGYTASSAEIAKAMDKFQSQTTQNVNTVAQYAAIEALSNPHGDETISKMANEFKRRSEYMTMRLSTMPKIKYTTPCGAFYVLIDITQIGKTATEVANRLLTEAKIAVVPADLFGAPGQIRLSYALSMEEIKQGLDRLEKFLYTVS
jgi:aspartate aminotransferase